MLRQLFVLVALLTSVSPALAQADAAKERAKALFIEGRGHFAAGRLAKALTAFEQANAIKPHPLMLFNIAQVYESMKDLPQAVATLRRFNASELADAESKAKQTSLERTLSKWPRVVLSTAPPGAKVFLGSTDTAPRCTTPCTAPIPPGRQNLYFTLAGHQVVARSVRFSKGQKVTFPPVALPALVGQVRFTTTPPGARVVLDSRGSAGVTPFNQAIPVGNHEVVITLADHKPVSRRFKVAQSHSAEAPLVIELTLEKGIAIGQLSIEVTDPGAEIRVDGRIVGVSPMQAPVPLATGMHRVEVRAPGHPPYEEVVNVLADGVTRARISFKEEGPGFTLTQRTVSYALMGLGGAALIGGAATGLMAFSASGDLDDCRANAACSRTQQEVAYADDVRSGALTTDILIGAGVALAATGAVLYFLDDGPAEARANAIIVTPTAGGVAAVGQFSF